MFRAAFHTGYVPSGVLRLTKQQLDGACADDRFNQVFCKYLLCTGSRNLLAGRIPQTGGGEKNYEF